MAVFYLSRTLRTNQEGYNSLAMLYHQIIQSGEANVDISFLETTWFEANLCAVLGAIIRILSDECFITIKLVDISPNIHAILIRNCFLKGKDYSAIDFSEETVVTFQQFSHKHDAEFDNYLIKEDRKSVV